MLTEPDFSRFCINRNIVECKACLLPSIISKLAVLIETSWNVKHISRQAYKQQLAVLIETSWNVKVPTGVEIIGYLYVLIETSWNVKYAAAAELPDIGVMY